MISKLTIDRATGDGKYADVLDVAERLANGDYGSATNAVVVMIRQSPLFAETIPLIKDASHSSERQRQPAAT